jgi:hypothetical protein
MAMRLAFFCRSGVYRCTAPTLRLGQGLGVGASTHSLRLRHSLRSSSTATSSLRQSLSKRLEDIRAAGTWKVERVITTPQAAAIRVQDATGELLNFCANNYLGLSVS